MNVVTRFAPSPTGFLHIGGARTALFNWLFARHHGGTYLLRIEDTDRQRSTAEAIDAIHDGLSWLGLAGDEPAISQSARASRHAEVALELVSRGAAYCCYLSEEELASIREEARAVGVPVRSPWRDRDDAPDSPFVVRMRMPDSGETTIDDAVQGRVTVQNRTLDDMVILRADGTPTYMLAVVVDDHDMGITHVIRGDDHLNNAFRQTMVYQGMGWDAPVFAHIPLIHGADGAKLSKRHGALGVDAYRDMGYLPDAMANYLLRLGWSHGDDEIISREDAIAWFDLARVGKSPARFDLDKLADVNSHYLRRLDAEAVWNLIMPHVEATSPAAPARVVALMPLLAERATTHLEIAGRIGYLLRDGAPACDEDAAGLLDDDARTRLLTLADALPVAPWTAESLQAFLKEWLAANELKMKDIGLPLRAALTGTRQSPSITDVMVALGPEETEIRIRETCKI
ncbi:MAG: glutamate--tRNA ligase [Pseudomonadota bacterium]|nr:glutamate--tRNA ligase [Pseudomonadota bacterium]